MCVGTTPNSMEQTRLYDVVQARAYEEQAFAARSVVLLFQLLLLIVCCCCCVSLLGLFAIALQSLYFIFPMDFPYDFAGLYDVIDFAFFFVGFV